MAAHYRGDWRLQRCSRPGCLVGPLRVQRDRAQFDSWWIGTLNGNVWRTAARDPVCPACGSELNAPAPKQATRVEKRGDGRAA